MKYCPICEKHGFAQVPVMQGSEFCSECDMQREVAEQEADEDRYNSENY